MEQNRIVLGLGVFRVFCSFLHGTAWLKSIGSFLTTWCTSETWMTEPSCVNVSIPGRGREQRWGGEPDREGECELEQLLVRWWWGEEVEQEMLSRSGR